MVGGEGGNIAAKLKWFSVGTRLSQVAGESRITKASYGKWAGVSRVWSNSGQIERGRGEGEAHATLKYGD